MYRSETLLVYGTSRLVMNTEQVRPVGGDALAQLASRLANRNGCHDAVEPAIQVGKGSAFSVISFSARLVVARLQWPRSSSRLNAALKAISPHSTA